MAKHIAVLGVIATLLVNWLSDEAKAWLPWCGRKFFDLSVRLLPPCERERYSEEWRGHIESFPGTGFVSVQFILAALQIRGGGDEGCRRRTLDSLSRSRCLDLLSCVLLAECTLEQDFRFPKDFDA